MQMRRRFQPMVNELPYRIAPSSIAAVAPHTIAAPPGRGMPTERAFDTDMPQSGASTTAPIILAAPPTAGDGTVVC
jgi:hypothetical protein